MLWIILPIPSNCGYFGRIVEHLKDATTAACEQSDRSNTAALEAFISDGAVLCRFVLGDQVVL